MQILVTVTGAALIGCIYWFFFGKHEEVTGARTHWDVTVEGGYRPSVITVPAGRASTVTFTRTDPNTCLEEFIIEDFKVKKFLPVGTPVTVTLTPPARGTYGFHCGMNMFHGKVIAV